MNPKPKFSVKYLPEAVEFLNTLEQKIKNKIEYNIVISTYEINRDLFKKLNENIWEFRTRFNGMAYRLFAFWDNEEKALVIATHGIIKKTQKTPSKEIKKAEEIMKLYYQQKNENGKDENI